MARSSRVRQPFSASSDSFKAKKPKSGSSRPTIAESKAAGYAKRHAAKKMDTKTDDVYEFTQSTQSTGKGKRRANVTLELDHGEDLGDDEAREELRARLLGSDEELDSEDDEDLDSDAAFESEDEERYAGFFGKGYKSEDSEEQSEDGEFIDVLDVLDGRQTAAVKDDSDTSENEDEDEDGDLDALTSFVSSLPTAPKRKPEEPAAPEPKRRRVLKEQPAGPENPFAATSSSSSTKLQLEDLLSLPRFKPTAALSAPLQLRAQERLDREAAYTATKAEVDKWSAVMRRVQDAEYLSFPLQPAAPEAGTSTAALSASFTPRTELESSVDALLRKGGLRDEDVSKTEEVLGRGEGLTVDEVRERRRELRERRELMFRAERKMKRVKRIKSKLYRKHHRKEGQQEEDEEDGDKARAMERATLRHKNTAKLARAAQYEDDEVEGSRKQIEEMLERGERLRRKIRGDDDEQEEEEQDPYDELQQLRGEQEEQVEGKGVMGIKFMQDAMKKREKAAQDEVEDLIRELDGAPVVERTGGGGRMVFRPETSKTVNSSNKAPDTSNTIFDASTKPPDTSNNPWLAASPSGPVKKSTKLKVVVDKNSRSADKAAYKLSKSKPSAAVDEEEMEIDGDEELLLQGDSTKAFRQRDLVKQAFAGDDVVREFAERKQAEVEGDKPKIIDNTLPGWGAWSGPGTAPAKPNPKYAKHVPGIAPAARSDAGKAHVIISQRVDKKFVDRYMVKDLPYPFTSKAQYEGKMAGAVGREWNTRVGFQRGTRGRVTKKMGQVIEPLEKMHS